MTRILREVFTGVRVIRAFNREKYENDRFAKSAGEYCDVSVRTGKIFAILLPTLTLLTNLGIVIILWSGGTEASSGAIEIGEIFALIEYLTIILFTGIMAILVYIEFLRASSCAERLNEVLEHTPEIKDCKTGKSVSPAERASLEFRNVTFRYPGAEEAFTGQLVIKAFSRENIAYSKFDALEEEILEVSRAARIEHFIRTMPDDSDTILEEEGINLSQGQRQLLNHCPCNSCKSVSADSG